MVYTGIEAINFFEENWVNPSDFDGVSLFSCLILQRFNDTGIPSGNDLDGLA